MSRKNAPQVRSIYSENNDFQHCEVLKRNREKRNQYGEMLIEGVALIKQARAFGWEFSAFIYSSTNGLSDWAKKIIAETEHEYCLDLKKPELLAKLSEKDETSEILAIVKSKSFSPTDLPVKASGLIAVFDRPNNPGNLGSSIRSCDSFGVDGVVVTGHGADPFHPQSVRGSMGAIFALPIVAMESHKEVLEWRDAAKVRDVNYKIVGTSAKAEKFVMEEDFSGPTILILGNETWGMSKGYKEICDALVKIPISGSVSSLNVSCAASIALYELVRQRLNAPNK